MVSTVPTLSLKAIYIPRAMIKWTLIAAPVFYDLFFAREARAEG